MTRKPKVLTYVTLAALAGCSPEKEPEPVSRNFYRVESLGSYLNVSVEDCNEDGRVDLVRLGKGVDGSNVYITTEEDTKNCTGSAYKHFTMPKEMQAAAQNTKVALDSLDFRLRKAEFDRKKQARGRGKQ